MNSDMALSISLGTHTMALVATWPLDTNLAIGCSIDPGICVAFSGTTGEEHHRPLM